METLAVNIWLNLNFCSLFIMILKFPIIHINLSKYIWLKKLRLKMTSSSVIFLSHVIIIHDLKTSSPKADNVINEWLNGREGVRTPPYCSTHCFHIQCPCSKTGFVSTENNEL
jgi:hypothetical protein